MDETLFRSLMNSRKEFDKKIIDSFKLRQERELLNQTADRFVDYKKFGFNIMSETLNAKHLTVKDKKKTIKAINKVLKDFEQNKSLMVKMGDRKSVV